MQRTRVIHRVVVLGLKQYHNLGGTLQEDGIQRPGQYTPSHTVEGYTPTPPRMCATSSIK